MNRPEILDLLQRYHPLPGEMRELGALVRAAPDPERAGELAVQVLWAEYQQLWFALERDWTRRSAIITALASLGVLFLYDVDPWAAFNADLSRPEERGPARAKRLPAPVRLYHRTTPYSAEPFFEEVHVPKLAAVPLSPADAEYLVVVPVDDIYDPKSMAAGYRAAKSAAQKKLSGSRPDWELLLQLLAERARHPDLTDHRFCSEMVSGYSRRGRRGQAPSAVRRIDAWARAWVPLNESTVKKDLRHAVKLFGRLTPGTPLALLVAQKLVAQTVAAVVAETAAALSPEMLAGVAEVAAQMSQA
jgi:hypothetical protein